MAVMVRVDLTVMCICGRLRLINLIDSLIGVTNMKRLLLTILSLILILSLLSCTQILKPQITYGVFPFTVVYELYGETVTVNDAYICEYEGIEWNEGFGKHRQWKGYVSSSGDDYLLIHRDGDLKIVCDIGSAAYYMSDPTMAATEEFTPYLYYVRTLSGGGVSSGVAGIEKLLEQYGIRLLSWQLSEPIANVYE